MIENISNTTSAHTIEDLVREVGQYLPDFNNEKEGRLRMAYEFAKDAHENHAANKDGSPTGKPQLRYSGEPYITHPLETALILARLRTDLDSVIVGLLHDVIEDTTKTQADIQKVFGSSIAALAEKMVKVSSVRYRLGSKEKTHQVENLRKMFLAMAEDMRAVFIKLADRLHNMRTLHHVPVEKQRRIALETLEIYAPLADRLGIFIIKPELEDLCFQILHPKEYEQFLIEMNKYAKDDEKYIDMVRKKIRQIMKKEGIEGEVKYRLKHNYSVWNKMISKNKSLDEIFDRRGVRIVVDDVPSCYRLLGVIHHHFSPMLGRIKDYIATPKINGYQSLHTTVFPFQGKLRRPTEIQIRTQEMNQLAEIGAAAHFAYSAKKSAVVNKEAEVQWIKNLAEFQNDLSDNDEFQEALKLDFFSDRIFVYTPYGDIKDLPRGSTPIDFAFMVHSDMGTHCKMAKVNNKPVTLHHELKNGDTVEILTSIENFPKYEWLSFVKTSAARSKIKQYLRTQNYEKNHTRGLEIINHELKKLGHRELNNQNPERQNQAVENSQYKKFDDLVVAVGEGTEKPMAVIKKMYASEQHLLRPKPEKKPITKTNLGASEEIIIGGLKGLKTKSCNACHPQPGNKIVGFVSKSQGIKIHEISCKYLRKTSSDRIVPAYFVGDQPENFEISTVLTCKNRVGMLRDVASLFASLGINIININVKRLVKRPTHINIHISFEVGSANELSEVFSRVSLIPSVEGIKKCN